MKSFTSARDKLVAISPVGNLIVEIGSIRLSANISTTGLFTHLSMDGKFTVRYDFNRSVSTCSIDLQPTGSRMQPMSIKRIGQDVLLKLKKR